MHKARSVKNVFLSIIFFLEWGGVSPGNGVSRMFICENISRNLDKIQKIWAEQGSRVVFKEVVHLASKKLAKPADKRTLLKREALLNRLDKKTLIQDMERVFSRGLLRSLNQIKSDIRSAPRQVAYSLVQEAKRLLANEFTLYGGLKVRLNKDSFSWLRDPLSGFVWPSNLSSRDVITKKPPGTDIKNIWEIARFQFLSSLAHAYILTGEEKYARFAIDKVSSWIDENTFPCGPHWTMAMEASIRLMNWCFYLPLMDVLKFSNAFFCSRLGESLFEHLIFIRENLEISPSQAENHYLSNLAALLLGRLVFPSVSWASESSEFAEKELEREIPRQFKKSGINFEGSLPYHRLSSEISLVAIALIKRSGQRVPQEIAERLQDMDSFTRFYTDICEECPIIGDNDSGIFVKFFAGQQSNRHQYLACLFDYILRENSEPRNLDEFLTSVHFTRTNLPNSTGSDRQNGDDGSQLRIRDFGGLIIARHKSEALFLNTLRASGGHTHNDKLSIYPVIKKKPLFIDRGSFTYTGLIEKRHKDRMTSSHNGPAVKGWEQNSIWKNDAFYISGEAKCHTIINNSRDMVTITAWHTAYTRYKPGMILFREVRWDTKNRTMLITDWAEAKIADESFQFTWYFLIHPAWTPLMKNGCLFLRSEGKSVCFEDKDAVCFTLRQGVYCPTYQMESPCKVLTASCKAKAGEKIRFLLRY